MKLLPQVCGSSVDVMTRCAELINNHCSVDFIDINCGCPIDLVYRKVHTIYVFTISSFSLREVGVV